MLKIAKNIILKKLNIKLIKKDKINYKENMINIKELNKLSINTFLIL